MPSLDIFCLRIFIAFSRLSRTSTSTGLPNVLLSMGGWWVPDQGTLVKPCGLGLVPVLIEQRDGQAVELGIRALRDDLVHDLVIGMAADPVGDQLTQELALLGLRRREHFHAGHVDHPALILNSLRLHACHDSPLTLRALLRW